MSSSTDNVRPSPKPNIWRIRNLTIAGVILGFVDLLFCVASLVVGKFYLGLGTETLQTLVVVTLVFSGQAVFYASRERRHLWSSRPGPWLIVSSLVDLTIITLLASNGVLMMALPVIIIGGVFGGAVILALVLDSAKFLLFRRLTIV
jgi:H+-transporting ATPase